MRRLRKSDLTRANIPKRFWDVSMSEVDELDYKEKIKRYIDKMNEMFEDGVGLYMWSEQNLTGKTALAVIIGKYAMRNKYTVFFEESSRLKNEIMNNDKFDDVTSVQRRATNVDLLILDDIGKEYKTNSGYAENLIETIIRDRVQSMKPTIITGNLKPDKIKVQYSPDLAALFRQSFLALHIEGMDWGTIIEKELLDKL